MNNSEYDVIVIGAGPAGLIWVDEALKNEKKVLLIDQGAFKNSTYSSIGVGWTSDPEVHLGGVGGTANAWQGQCVLLDAAQFSEIFDTGDFEAYKAYLEASKTLAKKLSIKFDQGTKRLQSRAISELQLPDNVRVKFSYMPIVQDWNRIFESSLTSKSLDFLVQRVDSLRVNGDHVSSVLLSDNREIQLGESTQLVIATNSISTAHLLSRITEFKTELKTEVQVQVYDHPWRTKNRYKSNGNKFARRKVFTSHTGFGYRMKTKYKFEVVVEDLAIGVFELRPEFKGSILSKIVARSSQKILGFSLINPTYVDVWCQIAQSYPIHFPNSGVMEECLDLKDLERLANLEEIAKEVLVNSGFALIERHENLPINQAFHTTGTLKYSNKNETVNIEYPGVAVDFKNLFVSGGAALGNCSWINPTFTIMVLALLNAQKAFRAS